MSHIKSELELFDKQFGKAGEEKNCDSIGRIAGCDDCSTNIEEREEHRAFLIAYHLRLLERVEAKIDKTFKEFPLQDWSGEAEVYAEIEILKGRVINELKSIE